MFPSDLFYIPVLIFPVGNCEHMSSAEPQGTGHIKDNNDPVLSMTISIINDNT